LDLRIESFLKAPGIPSETIPEIELYMDQILGFLEERLGVFERGKKEKAITKTMINNYVKARVIKRPNKKKYGKEQMERIIMLYHLKNVLSLKDIEKLFGMLEDSIEDGYGMFRASEEKTIERLLERYEEAWDEMPEGAKIAEIIELAIEADLKKRLAEKLMDDLTGEK
jgi:phosphatidylinositol kinase/protein kinase (PI-3  family)